MTSLSEQKSAASIDAVPSPEFRCRNRVHTDNSAGHYGHGPKLRQGSRSGQWYPPSDLGLSLVHSTISDMVEERDASAIAFIQAETSRRQAITDQPR